MSDELVKEVTLQSQKVREGVTQFKLTIPSEFVNMACWKKGDVLSIRFVLGLGRISIEKKGDK